VFNSSFLILTNLGEFLHLKVIFGNGKFFYFLWQTREKLLTKSKGILHSLMVYRGTLVFFSKYIWWCMNGLEKCWNNRLENVTTIFRWTVPDWKRTIILVSILKVRKIFKIPLKNSANKFFPIRILHCKFLGTLFSDFTPLYTLYNRISGRWLMLLLWLKFCLCRSQSINRYFETFYLGREKCLGIATDFRDISKTFNI
jgi:hypothetical protein